MTELVRAFTRSLEQAGIPSMPFKGPALALQLYGGLECRQFKDLDLVVPPDKAVHAAEILRAMGYDGKGTPLPELTPRQQQWTLARLKDAAFFKSLGAAQMLLELHWRLTIAGFDAPIVMDHGPNDRIESNHGTLHTLPAIELTLFLAYHGACHRFFGNTSGWPICCMRWSRFRPQSSSPFSTSPSPSVVSVTSCWD